MHTIERIEIEFDPEKAAANPLNHDGVTFGEAKTVLLDPYALTREDTDTESEARFVTLGRGEKGVNSAGGVDATRRNTPFDFCLEGQPSTTEML